MKELRSRRYPNRQPQIVSDDEYQNILRLGIERRFTARDIEPVRNIIPTPKIIRPVIEEKRTKKKSND